VTRLGRASRRRASTRLQLFPQELYKRLQRHGYLSPTGIIKKDCRRRRPPILQQGDQPPRIDIWLRVAKSRVEHAHAVERGSDGQFGRPSAKASARGAEGLAAVTAPRQTAARPAPWFHERVRSFVAGPAAIVVALLTWFGAEPDARFNEAGRTR
jgi:hypothetical protein